MYCMTQILSRLSILYDKMRNLGHYILSYDHNIGAVYLKLYTIPVSLPEYARTLTELMPT